MEEFGKINSTPRLDSWQQQQLLLSTATPSSSSTMLTASLLSSGKGQCVLCEELMIAESAIQRPPFPH